MCIRDSSESVYETTDLSSLDSNILKIIALFANYEELKKYWIYEPLLTFLYESLKDVLKPPQPLLSVNNEAEDIAKYIEEYLKNKKNNSWFGYSKLEVFNAILIRLVKVGNFYDASHLLYRVRHEGSSEINVSEFIKGLKEYIHGFRPKVSNDLVPLWNEVDVQTFRDVVQSL
eukprot:TRINITY_DN11801_c0_g1_i1.p1 TRINITY_DN11801_c0_g1~~TRINITY_DN11801_c0_g1_i1.p1  ORF type:complete len:193 (+),score=42.81 TRINITY_DN11801_c0_g1_i1:61-579(+)